MKKVITLLCILFFLFGVCAFADSIVLDGDFTDWVDKPTFDAPQEPNPVVEVQPSPSNEPEPQPSASNEPQPSLLPDQGAISEDLSVQPLQADAQGKDNNGIKFKVSQLRWHLSDEEDVLYIMVRFSHPEDLNTGSITTHFITDFGEFNAITTYDTGDGTVLSKLNGQPIDINGKCEIINKNTIEIEYGIPLGMLIEDIRMGYLIQFKVMTEDDEAPNNSYITVSTASTMPFLGVGICAAFGVGIPYLMKRKRKQ